MQYVLLHNFQEAKFFYKVLLKFSTQQHVIYRLIMDHYLPFKLTYFFKFPETFKTDTVTWRKILKYFFLSLHLRYNCGYLIGFLLLQTISSDIPSWLPQELLKTSNKGLVFISFFSKNAWQHQWVSNLNPLALLRVQDNSVPHCYCLLTCAHVSFTVYKRCRES